MYRINRLFSLVILVCMTPFLSRAQQIAGGEFSWISLGKDSFQINLTLYVSCLDTPPATPVVYFDCVGSGQSLTGKDVHIHEWQDVTNVCLSQCSPCLNTLCTFPYGYKKYVYSFFADFTDFASCCEVRMYYKQYRRSDSITNASPSIPFFLEAKLNRCVAPLDNSPVFLNPPLFLSCKDQLYEYSLAAFDPDMINKIRDSITFEFTTPKLDTGTLITYNSGFAFDKPLTFQGFPNAGIPYPQGMHLDSFSGELRFQPIKIEQTPIAVKIRVYRNGQQISEITREWLQVVMDCNSNLLPQISGSFEREHCAEGEMIMAFTAFDYNTSDHLDLYLSAGFNDPYFVLSGTPSKPVGYIQWMPDNSMSSYSPYFFTVGVKDNVCPVESRQIKTVRILLKENVKGNISIADSGCGRYAFFTDTVYGNIQSVLWEGEDSIFSQMSSFIHQFTESDTFLLKMILTAANGCKYTDYLEIIPNMDIPIVFAGSDDSICYDYGQVLLHGIPDNPTGVWEGTGVEKIWDNWCFNLSDENVVNNAWHQLIYTYYKSQECSNSDTLYLFVVETPRPEAGLYDELCPDASPILLRGKPNGGFWKGLSVNGNFFNPEIGEGVYDLIYGITTNGKCPSYDTAIIKVNASPIANFATYPVNGDVPLKVIFYDSSTITSGSIDSYVWNFGDGQISYDTGSTAHTYTEPGDYSVVLIVRSDAGCESFVIKDNIVNAWPQSVDDDHIKALHIYPQLATDRVFIYSDYLPLKSFQLMDMNGKLLMDYAVNGQFKIVIERNGLESGMYLLKVNWSDGISIFHRFVFR